MKISPASFDRIKLSQAIFFCLVLAAAAVLVRNVATGHSGIASVIVFVAGVITATMLFYNEGSRWTLFCLGVATIALGHRSVYVGPTTYLVPLQIIAWLLFFFYLASPGERNVASVRRVPLAYSFVALWCALHGGINILAGKEWDSILAWTSPLVFGFPMFWIVGRMLKSSSQMNLIWSILLGVSGFMSVLCILEYIDPALIQAIPWIFSNQGFVAQDGFYRAAFSFWGYPAAAAIVTWGMLIAYSQFFSHRRTPYRIYLITVFFLGLVAVFVSGQRSSWIGVSLGLLVLSLQFGAKGIVGAGGLVLAGIVAATTDLVSGAFWVRLGSVSQILDPNQVTDTSIESRFSRWDSGVKASMQNPMFGSGYSHWLMHNVFLEISSTVGIIPAVLFAVFIIQLIARIVKVSFRGATKELRQDGRVMLALSITWVIQMNIETIFQTPPFAAAYWMIMAAAWYLPSIAYSRKVVGYQPVQGKVRA